MLDKRRVDHDGKMPEMWQVYDRKCGDYIRGLQNGLVLPVWLLNGKIRYGNAVQYEN